MKDTLSDNTTIISRSQSIVAQCLRTLSRILQLLCIGCVVSILVEIIGVTFIWPELGKEKSLKMVRAEIGHLGKIADRNPVLKGMDDAVIEKLAVVKRTMVAAGIGRSNIGSQLLMYFEIVINMINVFVLKVAVMVFSFPVYLFCGFVGLTRGLVNRELRKWGGGRESSGQFHLWINMVPLGFASSWLIYLSWPWTINPNYIVMPFALFFGFMLMLSAYRIKKYI